MTCLSAASSAARLRLAQGDQREPWVKPEKNSYRAAAGALRSAKRGAKQKEHCSSALPLRLRSGCARAFGREVCICCRRPFPVPSAAADSTAACLVSIAYRGAWVACFVPIAYRLLPIAASRNAVDFKSRMDMCSDPSRIARRSPSHFAIGAQRPRSSHDVYRFCT